MPTEKVKVLGIVGSPRQGGNTEELVDEVLRGARDAGASFEKIRLSELEIAPCDACDSCVDTGECVQGDDMPELLTKMLESQVWVLGTPVYWWGPSAQFKLFVDRWYSQAHRDVDKAMWKGRRVILAVPFGDDDPGTARHVEGMVKDALDYMHADLYATVLAPGVNDKGEIFKKPEILAAAHRAGKEAVTQK
jgi:multimeric flavodoxin WrbA